MSAAQRRKAPENEEDHECRVLADWLDQRNVFYTHIPSGGHVSPRMGAKRKRMGAKRGVPDYLIFDPPPDYPAYVGTAIEMKKRKGGRATPEQREWLFRLGARGWEGRICKGADEAIEYLTELGYGRGRR